MHILATPTFRFKEHNISDIAGMSFYQAAESNLYLLGLCNSPVANAILKLIAPTINYQAGDIGRIPVLLNYSFFEQINKIVKELIELSIADWDSFESSWDFKCHPLVSAISKNRALFDDMEDIDLAECYTCWENECNERFNQLKAYEEELNRIFIDIYDLQDELTPAVEDKDVTVRKADLQRDLKSLISYAVGCMFGRYSLNIEGLAYAGGEWNKSIYSAYDPDRDNIIPICDEEYFPDDIVSRFCEWVKIVYGEKSWETNLDFIAKALGNKGNTSREVIRNYFLNDFFKDHCNTYSVTGSGKRPIYWLFDSGKQNGFKALIYMHRYDADTVGRVRTDYLHKAQKYVETAMQSAPAISEFPSKFIYKGLLKDNSVVLTGQNKKKNDVVINKQPLAKDALNLVDMAGTYCAADKNTDGSRFNILSAVISFSTAVNAQNNNIDDVGIITPYAAQVRLIRAMLRDYYAKDIPSIRCATVHQFQGSESDVIVFDAVESYPKGAVGYLMGKEPNQVTRLINVAITRGKGKVIVVANARFWENIFKGRNHVFYRLLQHIKNKNHQVVEYQDKTLQPYVESINPGKVVDIFVDEQDAIAKFEQDMLKAKWKVVISLPSGALRETENQVFKLIDDADSRGVDILMKSNDYASLPQYWKNYCRGTENATFPLIIIDDEVSWYGLPTANWKFDVDKTTSLKTVVYMMVRFKGKNTVEMLKALTDIETVAIGVNTRKLLKKDNNMVTHPMASSSGVVVPDDGKSAYGLAGFVEEKEFCPACKSHMVLTKNARGTAYLKCSNKACKETKYLTVDLMNWYISSHNVGCPKHDGGELKGRLGKYGPYVTCTCGHTLKPHDI